MNYLQTSVSLSLSHCSFRVRSRVSPIEIYKELGFAYLLAFRINYSDVFLLVFFSVVSAKLEARNRERVKTFSRFSRKIVRKSVDAVGLFVTEQPQPNAANVLKKSFGAGIIKDLPNEDNDGLAWISMSKRQFYGTRRWASRRLRRRRSITSGICVDDACFDKLRSISRELTADRVEKREKTRDNNYM